MEGMPTQTMNSRVHLRLNPQKIDTKGFSTESVTSFHAY